MARRLLLPSLALVFIGGCSTSTAPASAKQPQAARYVTVSVDKPLYYRNDIVTFSVHDTSDQALPYSFCGGITLQRRIGTTWTDAVLPPPNPVCATVLLVLQPDSTVHDQYVIPQTVELGTYRLVFPEPIPAPIPDPFVPTFIATPTFEVTSVTL